MPKSRSRPRPKSAAPPRQERRLAAGVRKIVVFGTARNAGYRVRDPLVSPRHCEAVVLDDDTVTVRDLGSTSGTFVNGERVLGRAPLRPGDVLTIGSTSIPFFLTPEEAPHHDQPDPAADAG